MDDTYDSERPIEEHFYAKRPDDQCWMRYVDWAVNRLVDIETDEKWEAFEAGWDACQKWIDEPI